MDSGAAVAPRAYGLGMLTGPARSGSAATAVLACLALVFAACSSGPSAPSAPPHGRTSPGTDPTPTSASTEPSPGIPTPTGDLRPSPTPGGQAPAPLARARATWQVVGEGFEGPLQVVDDPRGGPPLVVEQVGRVTPLDGSTPVLDLTDRVTAGGERGLLGVAFHPEGDRLFVHYSGDEGQTVLSSFPVDDGPLDAAAEQVLLTVAQPAANHNGGALLFDPEGRLVLGLGDGGGAGDQFGHGQDPGTLLGTLLRFDVGAEPGAPLAPAPGNPFVDGGGAPEVWAHGLRNPWRIAFDDTHLYVADVGQDAVEEVSVVARGDVAGANFGWPVLEGGQCYQQPNCDAEGMVMPSAVLRHEDGACSIIGGVVVPEGHPTGLGGAYLFSDLCDTRLHALREGDDGAEVAAIEGAQLPASPLGFGAGASGQVWVGTQDGQVLELVSA